MLTWSLVTLFSTDKCLAAIMNATVGECLQKTSAFLHQVKIKLTVQAMTVLSSAKKSINLNLAYLSILRNFFAFSFVVGLLFMHKGCASAVQSLWQVLLSAHSICIFEILSKYYYSRAASKDPICITR